MTLSIQRPPLSPVYDSSLAGYFRVMVRPAYQPGFELSIFRGAPVKIGAFSFADPFGPVSMTINLPQVTLFDTLGVGDLAWARKNTDVDVIWQGPLPDSYQLFPTFGYALYPSHGILPPPRWRWEGYIESFGHESEGLSVELKGAMLQLDNWLAKPEYPSRPLPYEWAIKRAFADKPASRMPSPKIVWPASWPKKYIPVPAAPSYMIPAGVSPGENWSGLVTRSTGQWDPTLTGYIAGLLSSMYTDSGRFTLDLDAYRQPVLFHRDFQHGQGPGVVVIDPASPGVKISLREDWSQSITTVYGQGTGLNGVAYTGMDVSADGSQTLYTPLAALRQVYPALTDNLWFDANTMPREVTLQMQAGLDSDDARIIGRNHLQRFAEPGYVGTITLMSDPQLNGQPLVKHLVRAGMDVFLPRIFGRPDGLVLHVSASDHDPIAETTTLTVDSKQRDALTVEEVRLRGRDSLSISRQLVAGSYAPPVPDQMMPWDYPTGSGVIPSNDVYNATGLFSGMPNAVRFPWTEWLTSRPPKDAKWRSSYLPMGSAKPSASDNWITQHSPSGSDMGVPIKVSQAGSIRLLQVVAVDLNGNVLPVPFHISFYYVGSVNVQSMPQIPASDEARYAPYRAAQRYPFVRDGFETIQADGTKVDPNVPQAIQSVGLIRAYGTFYEKAGYYPGSYAAGDPATGLLVDESTWSFDITGISDSVWDPYRGEKNLTNPFSGKIYAMIYCDGQADQEVFFVGRMFRAEPGGGG